MLLAPDLVLTSAQCFRKSEVQQPGLIGFFRGTDDSDRNPVRQISVEIGKEAFVVGDFTHLPTHCKFMALMPQWDFLDFLLGEAERYPN